MGSNGLTVRIGAVSLRGPAHAPCCRSSPGSSFPEARMRVLCAGDGERLGTTLPRPRGIQELQARTDRERRGDGRRTGHGESMAKLFLIIGLALAGLGGLPAIGAAAAQETTNMKEPESRWIGVHVLAPGPDMLPLLKRGIAEAL